VNADSFDGNVGEKQRKLRKAISASPRQLTLFDTIPTRTHVWARSRLLHRRSRQRRVTGLVELPNFD
jgi:hypothetical protein